MSLIVTVHDGVNAADQTIKDKYDMHCPLMAARGRPKENNYYKKQCLLRQRDKVHRYTCYKGCKVKNNNDLHRAKLKQLSIEEVINFGKLFYEAVQQGKTNKALANEYSLSPSTVSRYIGVYLLHAGIDPKKLLKKSVILRGIKWAKMKKELGLTCQEIAEKEGISVSTVFKYIAQL